MASPTLKEGSLYALFKRENFLFLLRVYAFYILLCFFIKKFAYQGIHFGNMGTRLNTCVCFPRSCLIKNGVNYHKSRFCKIPDIPLLVWAAPRLS